MDVSQVDKQDIKNLTRLLWLVLGALVVLIVVVLGGIVDDHVDFRMGGGGDGGSQFQQD
jgi:hypothetical protein